MKSFLKWIRHLGHVLVLNMRETVSDIKYCGFHSDRYEKVLWRLLLLSHSLEKGLGFYNKKDNFGLQKAYDLLKYMIISLDKGVVPGSFEYSESVAILKKYMQFRQDRGMDNVQLKKEIEAHGLFNYEVKALEAGERILFREDVQYNAQDFEKLCSIRHSIREYSEVEVTADQIRAAVEIARTAPSACNRQMFKLYNSENNEVNEKLAEVVPGNRGFQSEPNKYLFITTDKCAFDDTEMDQCYVNGGIFAAFLQLAFTSQEIGSCIFQWPKNKKANKNVKKLLGIANSEVVVTVLGVGHYKDSFSVICSARRNAEDFIVRNNA